MHFGTEAERDTWILDPSCGQFACTWARGGWFLDLWLLKVDNRDPHSHSPRKTSKLKLCIPIELQVLEVREHAVSWRQGSVPYCIKSLDILYPYVHMPRCL